MLSNTVGKRRTDTSAHVVQSTDSVDVGRLGACVLYQCAGHQMPKCLPLEEEPITGWRVRPLNLSRRVAEHGRYICAILPFAALQR